MIRTRTLLTTRILFTLTCCIVFRGLPRAQDLTAADLLPPIGVPFSYHPIVDLFPWDTLQGTGVLWDYAWTDVDSTADVTYTAVALTDAPELADYPDADIVVRSISGAADDYIIHRYYALQTGQLIELGSVGPVLSYAYDEPQLTYGFPMALGDTLNDAYCFWSDGLGIQYHFCGESYTTFDAEGTLILPYGTYTGVKHVTHWSSSLETTGGGNDTAYIVRQEWFLPGFAQPVLHVSVFIDSGGQLSPNGRLLKASSLTALQKHHAQAHWQLAPNPTTGAVWLQGLPAHIATIDMLTSDGRVLHQLPVGNDQRIALDDLPDGLYFLRAVGPEGSTVQRLMKIR